MSLTALVTSTRGQPRGLELEGKLEEVMRDRSWYQKRGTFLLRSVRPLPLMCGICQEGLQHGGSRGGRVSRATWEAHAAPRGPGGAQSSEIIACLPQKSLHS